MPLAPQTHLPTAEQAFLIDLFALLAKGEQGSERPFTRLAERIQKTFHDTGSWAHVTTYREDLIRLLKESKLLPVTKESTFPKFTIINEKGETCEVNQLCAFKASPGNEKMFPFDGNQTVRVDGIDKATLDKIALALSHQPFYLPPCNQSLGDVVRFYEAAQKLGMTALLPIPRDRAYMFSVMNRDALELNELFQLAETHNDAILKGICLLGFIDRKKHDDPKILESSFFKALSPNLKVFCNKYLELESKDKALSLYEPHLPSLIFQKDNLVGSCYSLDQEMADFLEGIGVTSVIARRFENEDQAVVLLQRFSQVRIPYQAVGVDSWQLALKLIENDKVKILRVGDSIKDTQRLAQALEKNHHLRELSFHGFANSAGSRCNDEETIAQTTLLLEALKNNATLRSLDLLLSQSIQGAVPLLFHKQPWQIIYR